MRSLRDLILIKLLTFIAVDKISFRVVGRVLVASACLCKKEMSDDVVRSFIFHSSSKTGCIAKHLCKECEAFLSSQSFVWKKKKLFTVSKTSTAFVLSKRDSQNKNSSLMAPACT
jgi:hypothetical protein